MKKVKAIIKQLQETSGTNDKIVILRNNKENDLLKKILEYTYNPFKKYGVSERVINNISANKTSSKGFFELLDILYKNNINDKLREEIGAFKNSNSEHWDLYEKVILKDLRCNISAKTINKVWSGLIPTFNVMKAAVYEEHKHKIKGDVIASSKIDGFKCIARKEGSVVKLYSRNGNEYEEVVDVEAAALNIQKDSFIIDGELYAIGEFNSSEEGYKATSKILRKKGVKKGVKLVAYDYLELEEFDAGESMNNTLKRKENLRELLSTVDTPFIEYLEPMYIGNDLEEVESIAEKEIKKGEEGIIVSVADAKWEAKKSSGCLKLKVLKTGDILVTSMYEGTGKYKGMMGGVNCEFIYNGKVCKVDVGSGWDDNTRQHLYNYPEDIIGKVITVEYRGVTEDSEGNKSLRHPTVGEYPHFVRLDKDGLNDTNID